MKIIYHINLWRCFRNSTATTVSNNYQNEPKTFIFMGYFTHILGVFQTFIFPWVFGGSKGIRRRQQNTTFTNLYFLLKAKIPKNPGMSQERDYPYIPIRSGGVWILRETYPVAFRRGFGACVDFAVATEKHNTPRALRAGGTNSKFRTGAWRIIPVSK